jgi:hypothetical protein
MAYVYRHIRLDTNIPFYVGLGVKETDRYRRAHSKSDRNKHWRNIVNKAGYDVEIIMEGLTFEEACAKEIEFIALYGRADLGKGPLINLTDGGEGTKGWSPEYRERFSNLHKGRKLSDEHRAKLKEARKRQVCTEETRMKRRELAKHRPITKEMREKMAAKLRGRPMPQWQREILSKAAMGKKVPWCYKPIWQFNLAGEFVAEFESISAAAKSLGLITANIGKVLSGERAHCGRFVFRYVSDNKEAVIKEVMRYCDAFLEKEAGTQSPTTGRKIVNLRTGVEYPSISEAERAEGMKVGKIRRWLKNRDFSQFAYSDTKQS